LKHPYSLTLFKLILVAGMIKRFLSLSLMLFLFLFSTLKAQENSPFTDTLKKVVPDSLPYLKYPALPAFNILLLDSTTVFNTYNIPKGSVSALVFFDPDCKHCKATIKEITDKMDSLKDVQFYIFSARHDISMIKKFYDDYHLARFPNIKAVGMDSEFFFFLFYKTKFVPDIAMYDKSKKLIKLFEGSASVKDLYQYSR